MCKLQSLLISSRRDGLLLPSHDNDDDHIQYGIASRKTSVGVEPSSACLWAMVNDFLEAEYTPAVSSAGSQSFVRNGCGTDSSTAVLNRAFQEIQSIFRESCSQEAKIGCCVVEALKSMSSIMAGSFPESARSEQALPTILENLQREGYDAGLCVTEKKPGNAAGILSTGRHHYIDVILEEIRPGLVVSGTQPDLLEKKPSEKLIVDVGFPAHFEIARPLPAYQRLISILPSTFIGKPELLQRVVRTMSQAARVSLECHGMPIPPWRSFTFLLAKWLSPSCSRITSINQAKHVIHSTMARRGKPLVLAELNYSADLSCPGNPPAADINHENCKNGRKLHKFLEEDVPKQIWYPPPPTNPFPASHIDTDDTSGSFAERRRRLSVVSALARALAETQLIRTSAQPTICV